MRFLLVKPPCEQNTSYLEILVSFPPLFLVNFSTHFVIKDFITMTTFSDAFDKEYRRAYRSLFESKNFSDLLCLEDKSPLTRAVYCRRTFDTPTLQPRVPKHLVNSFP